MKIVNQRITNLVKKLNLPKGGYAVFGSAIMEVLGIRKSGDVDFIVSKKLFEELAKDPKWERSHYDNGDEVLRCRYDDFEVFWECLWIPGCNEQGILKLIENATIFDGVAFVSLADTVKWKTLLAREKDLKDVKLIERYLEETIKKAESTNKRGTGVNTISYREENK